MKKMMKLLTLLILIPLCAWADGWDEQLYKQIEQSIQLPKFGNNDIVITKTGAKTDAKAEKNQKAIQKRGRLSSY